MARRPAAIKDRARGSTRSVPLFFPVNDRRKTGGRAQPGAGGLSRKLQDDHGKCARPAPRGSAGLQSITGASRTKTGNSRNPSLQMSTLDPPDALSFPHAEEAAKPPSRSMR